MTRRFQAELSSLTQSRILAAHARDCLPLLPSGPGGVHSLSSHEAHSSTLRFSSGPTNAGRGKRFGSAEADCRYRAPLSPRLARSKKRTFPTKWAANHREGSTDRVGFEPTRLLHPHEFQSCSLNRSDTCPTRTENGLTHSLLERRQGEIRTLDTVARMTVFETVAFNHSATCPIASQFAAFGCDCKAARHILSNLQPFVSPPAAPQLQRRPRKSRTAQA